LVSYKYKIKLNEQFLFSLDALWSTQPLIQWVSGVKRPGREVDNSIPSSAEVKNQWI